LAGAMWKSVLYVQTIDKYILRNRFSFPVTIPLINEIRVQRVSSLNNLSSHVHRRLVTAQQNSAPSNTAIKFVGLNA
jgi:hypothetical protein